jgi:predicted DsbA family dithiol-disulfide isomerase
MNKEKVIRIDVVSDVVCPWCYIGKRRLEKAIEDTQVSDNVQVKKTEIIYRAYQLDPSDLHGKSFWGKFYIKISPC